MTGLPKGVARNGLGPDVERLVNYLGALGDTEWLLNHLVRSNLLPQEAWEDRIRMLADLKLDLVRQVLELRAGRGQGKHLLSIADHFARVTALMTVQILVEEKGMKPGAARRLVEDLIRHIRGRRHTGERIDLIEWRRWFNRQPHVNVANDRQVMTPRALAVGFFLEYYLATDKDLFLAEGLLNSFSEEKTSDEITAGLCKALK